MNFVPILFFALALIVVVPQQLALATDEQADCGHLLPPDSQGVLLQKYVALLNRALSTPVESGSSLAQKIMLRSLLKQLLELGYSQEFLDSVVQAGIAAEKKVASAQVLPPENEEGKNLIADLLDDLNSISWETFEAAVNKLVARPNLPDYAVDRILGSMLRTDLNARSFFHVLDNALFPIAVNSPQQQIRVFKFMVYDHPEVQEQHGSVIYRMLIAIGGAGIQDPEVRDYMTQQAHYGSSLAQNGAQIALGFSLNEPQEKDYHLALLGSVFDQYNWIREGARAVLTHHYRHIPEVAELMKDQINTTEVNRRMSEIINSEFVQ